MLHKHYELYELYEHITCPYLCLFNVSRLFKIHCVVSCHVEVEEWKDIGLTILHLRLQLSATDSVSCKPIVKSLAQYWDNPSCCIMSIHHYTHFKDGYCEKYLIFKMKQLSAQPCKSRKQICLVLLTLKPGHAVSASRPELLCRYSINAPASSTPSRIKADLVSKSHNAVLSSAGW